MARFRRQIELARLIATLAGGAYLCACSSWHAQMVEPMGRPAFDSTKTYRLVLVNGQRRVAQHPVVSGDSLVWAERGLDAGYLAPKRKARALSEIRQPS